MNIETPFSRKLTFDRKGAITCVTVNQEEDGASFNQDVLMELRFALREIDRDQDCKAVVLIGADIPFGTGDENAAGGRKGSDLEAQLHDEVLLLIDGLRPVTIAVRTVGSESRGDDLACACDLVVTGVGRRAKRPTISWAVAPYPGSKLKLASIADHLQEIEALLNSVFPDADQQAHMVTDRGVVAAPKKAVCKKAA